MATNTLIPKGKQELKREALGNSKLLTFAGLNSQQIAGRLQAYAGTLDGIFHDPKRTQRHIRILAATVKKTPQLMQCTAESIIGGMLQAAMLGLDFNSSLGYCYLVPYKGQAQFQIGYRGMLVLAHRSGQIKEIYAECVYKGDEFIVEYGLHRDIKHIPKFESREDKDITFVYAVAKTINGGLYYVILPRIDIEKLRLRSPAEKNKVNSTKKYDSETSWEISYAGMAKGKALKQLAKYLPMDTEIDEKLFSDSNIINVNANNELEYINEYEAEALNEIEEADAEIVADDATNENTETPKNVNLETGELYE